VLVKKWIVASVKKGESRGHHYFTVHKQAVIAGKADCQI